ncbi:MAG: AbrB/MazE/SpoVT family DNA-binding domain-containing protein [Candidatus Omnitrophota bacterium]
MHRARRGGKIPIVNLSTSYQISIPKEIREKQNMKPGERFILMTIGDRIELIPEKKIDDLFGVLSGMDTDPEREEKDR